MCVSCQTVTHSSHDYLRELVKQDFLVLLHVKYSFRIGVNSDTLSQLFNISLLSVLSSDPFHL